MSYLTETDRHIISTVLQNKQSLLFGKVQRGRCVEVLEQKADKHTDPPGLCPACGWLCLTSAWWTPAGRPEPVRTLISWRFLHFPRWVKWKLIWSIYCELLKHRHPLEPLGAGLSHYWQRGCLSVMGNSERSEHGDLNDLRSKPGKSPPVSAVEAVELCLLMHLKAFMLHLYPWKLVKKTNNNTHITGQNIFPV